MPASEIQLIIGGESCTGATQFERINPVTGQVATLAAAAGPNDAIAAVDAARAAFPRWSAMGPNSRRTMF